MVLEVEKVMPYLLLSKFSIQKETLSTTIMGHWLPKGMKSKKHILSHALVREAGHEHLGEIQRLEDVLERVDQLTKDIDNLKRILVALANKHDIHTQG